MSICILNVGRPRAGKSTKSVDLLNEFVANGRGRDIICYDINGEYKRYYNYPFLDYDVFIKQFDYKNKQELKNKIILIEEATIFFSTRSEEKILKSLLVRKAHTHNVIILNFHAFNLIPRYVFDLSNYVIIFKTNDTLDSVKSKITNPKFISIFNEVNSHPDLHFNKTFNLYS